MFRSMANTVIDNVRGFRDVEINEISDEIVEYLRKEFQDEIDIIKRKIKGIILELEKDGVDATSLMDLFVQDNDKHIEEHKESKKSKKTKEKVTEEVTADSVTE